MTLPATTPLWFRDDMGSAPVLRGVVGDAITLLDACLVNGFNSRTATSVVVSSNVATVTFSGAFGWLVNQVVEIAGATPPELNGWKRVSTVSGNTLTFPAPGVANTTATGTITCKTPGLGWAKVYSATNVAVYRAPDVTGTRLYLRVNDTGAGTGGASTARARGFETMSDVNTGTGPFPTDAQISGGLYWQKSSTQNTTARQWAAVGDGATLYVGVRASPGNGYPQEWGFGDVASLASVDAYRCFIAGSPAFGFFNSHGVVGGFASGAYLARAVSQTGGAIALSSFAADYGSIEYPHTPNSGLLLRARLVMESSTRARGQLRGVSGSMHGTNTANIFALGQVLSAADGYAGLGLCIDAASSVTPQLAGVIDLIGPW